MFDFIFDRQNDQRSIADREFHFIFDRQNDQRSIADREFHLYFAFYLQISLSFKSVNNITEDRRF